MAKVITIAQQKGGAGKTTVAAHIAVALAQKGNRVAVVDIDPQGSLTYWHSIREEKLGEGYTGLTFNALSGWRVGSEVSRLRRQVDYIIIDSPPHTETEARTAIRAADLILIPVQPSPTDLWATKATLDLAKAEKVPVRVVLNRVAVNSRLAATISNELPELADSQLGNRVIFASALMDGQTATEVEPTSPAAREVKALVKEILSLLKDEEEETTEDKALAGSLIMRVLAAEAFGTFAMVFAGTGAIIINDISGGAITHAGIALTFGLVVMAMIYAIGDVSGAHMNPAVTIGFFLARRFPAKRILPYIASQLTGALLASSLLYMLFPMHPTLGATIPASGMTTQSFVLEFVLTLLLMFVILSVSTGAKEKGVTAGIAVGAVIALEAMFAGPISGASMNPFRSLAPALMSGNLADVWIYLLAPTLGAATAVLTCRCVHASPCCEGA